ncbi:hypothetical protein MAR_011839 [Mya arenaria]|uniref:Uncharacterized protein n=1 Tax=Mya arenaria TaxID=6604 RepID=A0ABY7FVB5_MYAAR|nr:hypothetical protein MAR_011839 [Mya arenaria]
MMMENPTRMKVVRHSSSETETESQEQSTKDQATNTNLSSNQVIGEGRMDFH